METFTPNPTERSTEAPPACGGKCLGTDLKETAKRFEKGLNDSKAAVSEKLEEGRIGAERLLKHSRYAVEDGIEETVHQIKRHPLRSLAFAFAAGAAVGFLVPHLSHKTHRPNPGY
jgi:ElaB/YqjD/DUF883 family membrane-anchored ribosome-binding protein